MKKNVLTLLMLICACSVLAQNDSYKYLFNGNLNEFKSRGPVLTTLCAGAYGSEALPAGLTKQTYRFNSGCGVMYSDAVKNLIASGGYTIEIYFRLDTISGYRKLVDFDSLRKDAGLYNQGGKLVLYPNFTSADSFMGAGVFQYVAITRNATTKKMYINGNGKSKGTYDDNTGEYKLGVNKLLMFFRDDTTTSGEQSKGAVAMIQISNYPIDSNIIKSNYPGLSKTLGLLGVATVNEVLLYPNPAAGFVHVSVATACDYSICDVEGRTIRRGSLQKGDNRLLLDELSSGLYILKMLDANGAMAVRSFIRD